MGATARRPLGVARKTTSWAFGTSALLASFTGSATGQALPGTFNPIPGIARQPRTGTQTPLPPPPPLAPGRAELGSIVAISAVAPVDGVSAYPPGTFDGYVSDLIGPAVPVQRIEAARTRIMNRYRADGFVYIAAQAHISRSGRLRFVVTEGRVVDVKLEGDPAQIAEIGPVGNLVLRMLRNVVSDHAINQHALERYLLLVQDLPGLDVHTRLDPSKDDPGALTLVAQVTRQKVSAQLTVDNRAFRNTGPEEVLGVVNFNSFSSLGEQTQFSIYHTFNDTDTFGQASESFAVGSDGLRLRLYGGAGEATPSGELRAVGYDGVTRVFGSALSYPVIRTRAETLTASALFDGVESDISTLTSGSRKRSSFESLRILRADFDNTSSDFWLGSDASSFAEFRVSQGLPTFGARPNGSPQLPRLHERVDFTKVNAELDRTQTLFTPFPGATVFLKAAVEGQYSGDVLPPEEKLYLGGPHFNRGFYYGEVTGDKGVAATIEPQLDMPLGFDVPGGDANSSPWVKRFIGQPVRAQFYGFFDWGETWENQTFDVGHILRSVGGGVRLYNAETYGENTVELDLEGVSRLTRTPDGSPVTTSRLKSSALYWQILVRY